MKHIDESNTNVTFGRMPLIAIGSKAILLVKEMLNKYEDRILPCLIDDVEQQGIEVFPPRPSTRVMLYDRSEVNLNQAKKFITAAKVGGKVITCEIADQHEAMHTSRQIGANMLIRSSSHENCRQALTSLIELAFTPGLINLDIHDVFSLFEGVDYAMVGSAIAQGTVTPVPTVDAIMKPWMRDVGRFTALMVNIIGGDDNLTVHDATEVSKRMLDYATVDANIIWDTSIDEALGDKIKLTVIASAGLAHYSGRRTEPGAS